MTKNNSSHRLSYIIPIFIEKNSHIILYFSIFFYGSSQDIPFDILKTLLTIEIFRKNSYVCLFPTAYFDKIYHDFVSRTV